MRECQLNSSVLLISLGAGGRLRLEAKNLTDVTMWYKISLDEHLEVVSNLT
jgi:hypothetical protein